MKTKAELIHSFIKENPNCTSLEIATGTGISTKISAGCISSVLRTGRITRYRDNGIWRHLACEKSRPNTYLDDYTQPKIMRMFDSLLLRSRLEIDMSVG